MSGDAPIVRKITDLPAYLISTGDTVRLCELAGPDQGSSASVFLEIWEPGGAQPLNSHADSAEIFLVLSGQATALSDDASVDLTAGDVLVLQPGSEHRIINRSETEKLYTVTVMADDGGFARLVTRGTPTPLASDEAGALVSGLAIA
ncbi:cupin domain-containing protein [Microbacterium sp. LRZ72]|uniref:cupin domain-containing protein n=1 Tax=Microbacterium sp. LRZ72 TaxID=2942481 RepID=UPI0029B01A6B|nr:cupin domain-containing protein [Microbacterium sp. LRZ72]MDX2377678.1 cupin domain-containing protein [Microbacterium sp. LRZ72]